MDFNFIWSNKNYLRENILLYNPVTYKVHSDVYIPELLDHSIVIIVWGILSTSSILVLRLTTAIEVFWLATTSSLVLTLSWIATWIAFMVWGRLRLLLLCWSTSSSSTASVICTLILQVLLSWLRMLCDLSDALILLLLFSACACQANWSWALRLWLRALLSLMKLTWG